MKCTVKDIIGATDATTAYDVEGFHAAKDKFLQNGRNAFCSKVSWFESDGLKVYLRAGRRYILGHLFHVVDIATVDVLPHFQRKGRYSRMMQEVETLAITYGYDALFLENVHNPILLSWGERHGWIRSDVGLSECFFKLLKIELTGVDKMLQ